MIRRIALAALLVAMACTGADDAERAADQAYAAGRYRIALDGYRRLIRGDAPGRLVAKAAAAAEHAGERPEALAALIRLANSDPSRGPEAVESLIRLATAADQAADSIGLRDAILAIHQLAPDRVPPRLALQLLRTDVVRPVDMNVLIPYALAGGPEPAGVDSLLFRYARSFDPVSQCDLAVDVYRAVVRRADTPELGPVAKAEAAACEVRLGDAALGSNRPDLAEPWFSAAIGADSTVTATRAALIGLGRVLALRGDLAGARAAWVAAGAMDDSLGQVARTALTALDTLNSAGDTARAGRP